MFKNSKIKGAAWLALAVLAVLIYTQSQRQPDYTAAAMQHAPANCTLVGTWRDTDWPENLKQFKATIVLCDAPAGRYMVQAFDGTNNSPVVQLLDENGRASGGDTFTINANGGLTISDAAGPIKTLAR